MSGSMLPRMQSALTKRLRVASKLVYQNARYRQLGRRQLLLIVGCQRSGTTLMTRLFDADRDCRVFGEFSALSGQDSAGIRLNPLPDVETQLRRVAAPLVVAKPLVETQHVLRLLEHFPSARALFMYRSAYADVARSDLRKFGPANALENLRPIAACDPHNWRSEGASAAVCDTVRRFYSTDMNPNDAAALFWWARNRLFVDLELAKEPRVLLCQYEHLTQQPDAVMQGVYAWIGLTRPRSAHTAEVRARGGERTREFSLNPEVRALCDSLRGELDAHYAMRRIAADGPTS